MLNMQSEMGMEWDGISMPVRQNLERKNLGIRLKSELSMKELETIL